MLVCFPSYQIAPIYLNQKPNVIPTLRVRIPPPTLGSVSLQLQCPSILSSKSSLRVRCCSSTITDIGKKEFFTVSYLVNNFGFSPQKARLASNRVYFEDSRRPDEVVDFFRKFGFSDSQVREIIRRDPTLLVSVPEKSILPKLKFLLSQGLSKVELLELVTAVPVILRRSVDNYHIPMVDLVRSFHHSDSKKALVAIKISLSNIISVARAKSNISFLRHSGMPDSKIAMLLLCRTSRALNMPANNFRPAVEEVKEMGFDISKATFIVALGALKTSNKGKWQRKLDLFKKWGWSEQDFLRAFRKEPWCMLTSEHKIEEVMDYFVNQLGWDSVVLARYPILFRTSLEKKIIPRARVVQYLLSNGLIRDKYFSAFGLSEQRFLVRFVKRFSKDEPRLLQIYQEEMNV